MRLPKLAACLFLACSCLDAAAFQLGQLVTQSRLGEPLVARVPVFGASAQEAATLSAEVRPSIGLAAAAPERLVAERMTAATAVGDDGQTYIVLTTTAAVSEPAVRFRLRVHGDSGGNKIAHYALALLPTTYDKPARGARRTPSLALDFDGAQYGPVAAGQTLSHIVRELGFSRSEAGAVMNAIVERNPAAFVGGDADRLRLGALLEVPARAAPTITTRDVVAAPARAVSVPMSVTQPTAAPEATATVATTLTVQADDTAEIDEAARLHAEDAALAARLAELSRKFAAIRTRYAAQQGLIADASPDEARDGPAAATALAPDVVVAPAVAATLANAPDVQTEAPASDVVVLTETPAMARADAVAVPALPATFPIDLRIVVVVGALLAVAALAAAMSYAVRHRRMHRAHGAAQAADQEKLAEIARKTEKRLQLEGEVAEWLGRKKKPTSVESAPSFDEIDNRIAHGRYAEAEHMLREVIAATPANFRAKLRLAEIFYLNERTDEFVELAGELQSRHRADIGDEGWQRVMRMGRVLAPDRPPFSGPVALEHEA
ncbi:MAG: FimV family protein [Gammaproteobacteria bacterium]